MAQASDLGRMKIEAVARIFAETGIKSLFLHIHELLLKHQQKAQIVKLRNQWTQVNPQEWRTRLDMTVNIGLGIGTREQNLMHLNAIWQKQVEGLNMGWSGVTGQHLFSTASEIVKNANLKQPEMFFSAGELNPQTDEAMQLQQQQMELQQQQQKLDMERQQIQSVKLQLQAQKQMMDAEKERAKLELDVAELRRKAEKDENDLFVQTEKIRNELTEMQMKQNNESVDNVPVEIQKAAMSAAVQLEIARLNRAAQDVKDPAAEETKAMLASVMKTQAELITSVRAPRKNKILRDADGRAEGSISEISY
jgi:hypothetical protein